MVKIVPVGEGVSPHSPFFTTRSELDKVINSGENLADAFGLPKVSESINYSVLEIEAKTSAEVFVSIVAPTAEGLTTRPGGALQYLVPDRTLWSEAKFLENISN